MAHTLDRPARLFVLAAMAATLASPVSKGDTKMELTPRKIAARIRKHRTAEVTLTLTDPAGKPLARRAVTVRQVGHKFLFGCNAFAVKPSDTSKLQLGYQRRYADLLNFATLPFYWGGYERQPGKTNARRVRAMAEWCRKHQIHTKGHPLCWHTVFPKWGFDKPLDELWKMQLHRITREVRGFTGLIDMWDVVNEAVVMPKYGEKNNRIVQQCRKVGNVELIRQTFAEAVKANPKATLLLNDYDTSKNYEKLIADCLKAGVRIDVVGIQSHMHGGYRGAAWAWETCQRFARFGKPLHFTEATIISGDRKKNQRWSGPAYKDWPSTAGGEKRQAEQVAEFYTVLFSHPAVEAVTWWDFSDRNAWLGAPSGLIRKDMSPKPAYEGLMKLVKGKWWTAERKLTTDAAGKATFRGYLGRYALDADGAKRTFSVGKSGKAAETVKVK